MGHNVPSELWKIARGGGGTVKENVGGNVEDVNWEERGWGEGGGSPNKNGKHCFRSWSNDEN